MRFVPVQVVPATLKKSNRPMERRPAQGDRPPRRFDGPPRGDRDGYRGGPPREGGGYGRAKEVLTTRRPAPKPTHKLQKRTGTPLPIPSCLTLCFKLP